MANIFNIDFNNVVENLTPWFWRKTESGDNNRLISYLKSMIKPVQDISDDLLALQQETLVFLQYTGQHKVLEEYLNDTYDPTLRRIFITENDIASVDPVEIYLSGESTTAPLELYLSGEIPVAVVGFYLSSEAIVDNNFTVNIPIGVVFDSTILTAQLRNYVKATKNFNFVTF